MSRPEKFQVNSRHYNLEGSDPNRIYLLVSVREDYGSRFGNVSVRPVWLRNHLDQENKVTHKTIEYFSDSVYDNQVFFHWFEITCQYDRTVAAEDRDYRNEREPYAVKIGYQDCDVTLQEYEKIEAKMSFLRWLNGKIAKFEEKYGELCEDYGRWIQVIAAEIGAQGLICVDKNDVNKFINKAPFFLIYGSKGYEKIINKVIETGTVYFDQI